MVIAVKMEKYSIANRSVVVFILAFLSNKEKLCVQHVCRDWYEIKIPLAMSSVRVTTLAFSNSKWKIAKMLQTDPGSEIWQNIKPMRIDLFERYWFKVLDSNCQIFDLANATYSEW